MSSSFLRRAAKKRNSCIVSVHAPLSFFPPVGRASQFCRLILSPSPWSAFSSFMCSHVLTLREKNLSLHLRFMQSQSGLKQRSEDAKRDGRFTWRGKIIQSDIFPILHRIKKSECLERPQYTCPADGPDNKPAFSFPISISFLAFSRGRTILDHPMFPLFHTIHRKKALVFYYTTAKKKNTRNGRGWFGKDTRERKNWNLVCTIEWNLWNKHVLLQKVPSTLLTFTRLAAP